VAVLVYLTELTNFWYDGIGTRGGQLTPYICRPKIFTAAVYSSLFKIIVGLGYDESKVLHELIETRAAFV